MPETIKTAVEFHIANGIVFRRRHYLITGLLVILMLGNFVGLSVLLLR
jgi:hypothetical protein